MIDLTILNYKDKILVCEEIEIPKEYYEKMDVIKMDKVKVMGNITCDIEYNYLVNLDISSTMLLHDSVTYEEIEYPFTIKIEETLENSLKTLDLIEFLWHYIVLEVPIRITNSKIESIEKENYRVISEDEYSKKNNPFSDFLNEREE